MVHLEVNVVGCVTHEDLLTIVKRRKLQWYGHVYRSSGLAKTILQGTMKGGRRQGGQKNMWEDKIRQWTGLKGTVCEVNCCAPTTPAVKG